MRLEMCVMSVWRMWKWAVWVVWLDLVSVRSQFWGGLIVLVRLALGFRTVSV